MVTYLTYSGQPHVEDLYYLFYVIAQEGQVVVRGSPGLQVSLSDSDMAFYRTQLLVRKSGS